MQGGSSEICASVSHSYLSSGEYTVSKPSPSLSFPSLLSPSHVAPVFQVDGVPAVTGPSAKGEAETKKLLKFAKSREADPMMRHLRRQKTKPLTVKQKKRGCRAVAAEVKNYFSDGRKLKPMSQRIFPDPQKVNKVHAFFSRPPLTQEQKNLEIWRNMGPSKIKIQKITCRKIAASVQSYHFERAMAYHFQPKLKLAEPDIEDKLIICSLISEEIKWFFLTRTQLRQTCRKTPRIFPDPEKV